MDGVPWYTIYDCEHQTTELMQIDKIERLEKSDDLEQFYKIYQDGKASIWKYNCNKGFLKVQEG